MLAGSLEAMDSGDSGGGEEHPGRGCSMHKGSVHLVARQNMQGCSVARGSRDGAETPCVRQGARLWEDVGALEDSEQRGVPGGMRPAQSSVKEMADPTGSACRGCGLELCLPHQAELGGRPHSGRTAGSLGLLGTVVLFICFLGWCWK